MATSSFNRDVVINQDNYESLLEIIYDDTPVKVSFEGVRKIERYELRVKSPDPPIPFIILVPLTCVELTFPKISTSMAVFKEMIPSLRARPGLFDISEGRSTSLFLKKGRSS